MKRLSLLLTCVAALACASTASAADPLRVVDGAGSFAGGANVFILNAVGPATPDPNNPAFGTLELFSAADGGAHYIHGTLTCLTVKPFGVQAGMLFEVDTALGNPSNLYGVLVHVEDRDSGLNDRIDVTNLNEAQYNRQLTRGCPPARPRSGVTIRPFSDITVTQLS